MTPGQTKTLRVLVLAAALIVGTSLGLLVWEFHSLALHDSATISETVWVLWAHQPGPIALLIATMGFWSGVLLGHFLWQSERVYDGIRRREWRE